jgi:Domain of unknown function (DUF4115)
LLIGVAVVLVVLAVRRAVYSRRLTIEQSVDRYRRTLTAVQDATIRSRGSDAAPTGPTGYSPARRGSKRSRRRGSGLPSSRWALVVATLAVATVVTVAVVVVENRDDPHARLNAPTTTRTRATRQPTTTTSRAAPTTTVALVTPIGGSGTEFSIGRPTYTLVVQTANGDCWVDARDPAGASLYTGTLTSGASQSIATGTAGAVTMKLGNPAAVSVSIEGKPVPFTIAPGHPVTLHFEGHAASG